ncbi:dihydrolipoyl dehydrogenase [Tissierella sp. Yu-01]|uniref:dihydrolipoyl dehydrogenase n=1 Tax=Tissierella sp. Yu-01 TaxID=3035694 RepID=UPI00240DAA37|nr:dihydrolipoyl dehydrogenase [Tissierella sp. Yu-01]WFA08278.1 dihydrolipoyl dehydrogenase [Tissierella sp. Yu-01]
MSKYDVIIIGGGPGGYVAAIKAAQLGAKVAVIEREKLGGICLNWGCIPTKSLLISAKHYKNVLRSQDFGIVGINKDNVSVEWESMLSRKDSVVNKLVSGITMLFKKNNVELFSGDAKIINKNRVEVNGQILEGSNLIIATGATNNFPDIPGLKEALANGRALDSKAALQLEEIPKELIIIGNNTYAIEFATLFNAIGSKVTLIHNAEQIIPYGEPEMVKSLERQLKKDGIKILSKTTVKAFTQEGVIVESKSEKVYTADKYIVFLGMKANIEGFEHLNLRVNSKGFIETNDRMESNITGIYAIGDVNGKHPLAHVASAEGIVAVENIMGVESKLNYNLIPQVVYSFPEMASVGLSEEQANEKGHNFKVSKFPLSANGMAIAEEETVGFVKIISDNQYGEIIGVHILGSDAGNMISKAVAIMQLEGTVYDLAKTIHPHPTFSEALVEAAYGAIGKYIHI